MASVKGGPKKKFVLIPVETTFNSVGGSLRSPRIVTIKKSGYAYTSLEGTLLISDHLAEFDATRENLKAKFAANPKTGIVGFSVTSTPDEALGYMPIRDEGNSLYFHLGGVFKDYPTLRPSGTIECALDFAEDSNGNPCFVFDIKAGTPKKKTKRKKKSKKPEEEGKGKDNTAPIDDEEELDDEEEPDEDEDDDVVAETQSAAAADKKK